jgi:hypothetical protein
MEGAGQRSRAIVDRIWENADSDIPMLKEAKAEYAKLQ